MSKPRYRLTSLLDLRIGDIVWTVSFGEIPWTYRMMAACKIWTKGQMAILEGRKYVWKKTTLQTDAGTPSGRGMSGAPAWAKQIVAYPHSNGGTPELDDRGRHTVAEVRERGTAPESPDHLPGVCQPRAAMRMILGAHLMYYDKVAVTVFYDVASHCYFLNVPGGGKVLVEPNRFYTVVNQD